LYNKASETKETAPTASAAPSTEVGDDALTANPLDAITKPAASKK
jgi:hypothetical protein